MVEELNPLTQKPVKRAKPKAVSFNLDGMTVELKAEEKKLLISNAVCVHRSNVLECSPKQAGKKPEESFMILGGGNVE